jgi:hypothetical protein
VLGLADFDGVLFARNEGDKANASCPFWMRGCAEYTIGWSSSASLAQFPVTSLSSGARVNTELNYNATSNGEASAIMVVST